jgi:hypothetical protein
MANPLLPLMKHLLIEGPARRRTYAQLGAALDRAAAKLEPRLSAAPDTAANREQLRHIVGIERWGQRRLRVALGEPPVADEMDDYMPPADSSMDELRTAFASARRETTVLARQLEARAVDGGTRVEHNQFGPLSVRGWLSYLATHASFEGKRVR